MPRVPVYNQAGEPVDEVELSPGVFSVTPKAELITQAVRVQQAQRRVAIAATKTRGDVRGGGRKPWRQKGTGRARHGSIRSPLWKGGGVTFGPSRQRNFSLKMNKRDRRRALLMVLTDKLLSNKLVLLDKLSFPEAKTKHVAEVFQTLRKKFPELGRDQLLVLPAKDETVERAIRNLPDVALSRADSLNVVDLLREDGLVMLKDAVGVVEHTYHTLRQKNDTGRGSNTK